ncbi:hypothetical protein [Hoeflea sp.]|uniref:hypothetical protein n=1 Tax=Hoeflea sp. TaxID=1940281 RepID=UPI003B52140B
MTVGAFVSAVSRPSAENGPSTTSAMKPVRDSSDPLSVLENFVESGNASRKAFARERLEHLKEQMNTLMLFDLAPGFLVTHTARMTRELEAAATDFATATRALADHENNPTADARAEASSRPAEATSQDGSGLPPAYLQILEGDEAPGGAVTAATGLLSADDAETAGGFASVARHLRFVIDLATGDFDPNGPQSLTADAARNSASRVIDAMARLKGPAGTGSIYV